MSRLLASKTTGLDYRTEATYRHPIEPWTGGEAVAPEHILIVGAGPGGGAAATTLRERGFTGRISLVGADPHPPYLRPGLSKQYLRGESDLDSLHLDSPSRFAELDIDLRTATTVADIDPRTGSGRLVSGERIDSDRVILATGSVPRRLHLDGGGLPGVHTLRTVADADLLRARLAGGGMRLVVVGSGWIGMEVAASARMLGNDVTVLERDPVPLAAALGDEVGAFFRDLHVRNGVHVRPAVAVTGFTGSAGRVDGVRLADGEVVPADLVVVGIGADPDLRLAQRAGVAVDGGVLVDAGMRTSAERVLAVGDIASVDHPVAGVRIRSEHFGNALRGGAVAASAVLGGDDRYDDVPAFLSAQFDVRMRFVGFAPLMRGAELVLRGDPASQAFTGVWLAGDRPVAGLEINTPAPEGALAALVRRGAAVDRGRIADPAVPLEEL
jgi:3-phenylpropionate/trans-cinnamate dioxygenase ferredoxin reductase subunit